MKDPRIFKHKIRAVIFDLDGTLIDSTSIWRDVDEAFFKLRNQPVPEQYADEIAHLGLEKAAELTKDKYFPNEDAKAIMQEWVDAVKDAYDNKIQLKPGVIEFLDFLEELHICPVICTANSSDVYDQCMVRLGIYGYVSPPFYHAKDFKGGKGTSKIFDDIAKRLCCSKDEIMVFEDLLAPLKVAHDAGYFTVGINDKFSVTDPEENKRNCDFFANDFFEIIDFMKKNYLLKDGKGFTYTAYTSSTYELVGCDDMNMDTLIVPKTFNGQKVVSIGYAAFRNNNFKEVVFNDNIRSIFLDAFENSQRLEVIDLPRNLTEICWYAFVNCKKVKKIIFNNKHDLYTSAFEGLDSIEEIIFHPDQRRIPFRGLWFMDNLKEVHIIEGIELIDMQAFNHCSNLETVYLPSTVKRVADNAFYRCPSLKKVIYNGSKEDKEKINIKKEGNDMFINAEWIYLK